MWYQGLIEWEAGYMHSSLFFKTLSSIHALFVSKPHRSNDKPALITVAI
jgi:hypothetical protein